MLKIAGIAVASGAAAVLLTSGSPQAWPTAARVGAGGGSSAFSSAGINVQAAVPAASPNGIGWD
jgi:hypothetical protein